MKKKIVIVIMLLLNIISYGEGNVKNVILLIGDGMGVSSVDLARQVFLSKEDLFEFENADYLGLQKTYSANSLVTDSAAAGTALATGYKTLNGFIGVNPENKRLKNITEAAKENGKKTGIITTVTISNATPAAFSSHINTRNESFVLKEMIKEKTADIFMGGGSTYFDPRSEEFVNAGYSYIKTKNELLNNKFETGKILGLFSEKEFVNYIDREELNKDIPTLAEMTKKSLEVLSKNEDGFFLMLEGGKIDWHGHGHDLSAMMWEIYDFNEAFKTVKDFADKNPDTLIIVTSDHETGGLGLSSGSYYYKPEILKMQKKSCALIEKEISSLDAKEIKEYFKTKFNLKRVRQSDIKKVLRYKDAVSIGEYIASLAEIDWTTDSHTGQSVLVYAHGKNAEEFKGVYENTDIAKKIDKVMGLNLFQ